MLSDIKESSIGFSEQILISIVFVSSMQIFYNHIADLLQFFRKIRPADIESATGKQDVFTKVSHQRGHKLNCTFQLVFDNLLRIFIISNYPVAATVLFSNLHPMTHFSLKIKHRKADLTVLIDVIQRIWRRNIVRLCIRLCGRGIT